MFKCQSCGTQVPHGVSQRKRVTRKRPRTYGQHWLRVRNSKKVRDTHIHRELPRSKDGGRVRGKPRFIEILVPLHTGWEIAREIGVCPACFSKAA